MLVLSRRVGEQIVIGRDIFVQVLAVRGKKVRLGFEVPQEVGVHREEVYLDIHRDSIPANVSRTPQLGTSQSQDED